MWEVFFLGTARRIDSHKPSIIPGTLSCMAEGIAKPKDGMTGRESCRAYRVVNLVVLVAIGVDSRGRNDERMDLVVT
jgi:hypothetical protein